MTEANIRNAKTALTITTVLTLFVAGFEMLMAMLCYKEGMNIFDLASWSTANMNAYCMILIIANLVLLSFAVLLYKQNGISLLREVTVKQSLVKDILIGAAALAATLVIALGYSFVYTAGRTDLAYNGNDLSVGTVIMRIIALGFVSGVFKEIYFRGFAKCFVGKILGETKALLLFNVLFGLLDWYNFGYSFIVGLIWIFVYKKNGHLLPCMIAHGGMNIVGVVFALITGGAV